MRRWVTWGAVCGLALASAGCATLSDRARRIVVTNKAQVADCRFLQVVYGGHKGGMFPKNQALERAATARATHIVTLYDKGGKFTADAFDCAQKPAAIADASEATTTTSDAPEGPVPSPANPVEAAAPISVDGRTGSQEWVVAVMDVRTVSEKKNDALNANLMRNIGDQLRIFVAQQGIRTVDRGQQETIIKQHIADMKADSYRGCYDDACQLELGKALAASHILRTRITQFGSLCVLNGELIDLRAEVATAAASSRGDCEEEGFLRMSEEVAANLVRGRR